MCYESFDHISFCNQLMSDHKYKWALEDCHEWSEIEIICFMKLQCSSEETHLLHYDINGI